MGRKPTLYIAYGSNLNLPQMAEFALEALLRRLKRPELPGTVLLQSPVLISFNSSEPVQRG